MMRLKLQCKIRCFILLAALFCVAGHSFGQSAPVAPAHPMTAAQVRQLMTVTHSTDRMQQGIKQMIAQQKTATPYFPDAFWAEFHTEFMKLDWVAIATPIYQKYLSQEDAEKAIAFYSTEAGQHALDSSTAVYDEMSKAGFDQGKAIGMRLGEKYKDQIQGNMRKMQQSTPVAPGPQ